MATVETSPLSALYERDETAWLEAMAERIRAGDYSDLDYEHLREYLTDMAQRDRREVKSRLTVLLAHVLKWVHQPAKRTKSWRRTITLQKQELRDAASEGVLRQHAEAIMPAAYRNAVERAANETGLPPETFPAECEYTFEQLLAFRISDAE